MKISGICPKCESNKIAKVKSDSLGVRIGTGAFSIAEVNYNICCQCGYIEEWIDNESDLNKIWDKHNS